MSLDSGSSDAPVHFEIVAKVPSAAEQGKSCLPLEHVDPNLQMFYYLQINMHVLLITRDQGLPICSLVPCLLDICSLSTLGNESTSSCYLCDLARTICLAMLNYH